MATPTTAAPTPATVRRLTSPPRRRREMVSGAGTAGFGEDVCSGVIGADDELGLRLIRDQRLICEVSDPSLTQPHLRRARWADEGGRGLFLVAQLTHRWGSQYTVAGKTIWTEQLLEEVA